MRCSMEVLNSVYDRFARGVSRVRASCTVPLARIRRKLNWVDDHCAFSGARPREVRRDSRPSPKDSPGRRSVCAVLYQLGALAAEP